MSSETYRMFLYQKIKQILISQFMTPLSYQEFLRWFCETLFQVFHPGASFSRCLMALHLLGLIAEHFTFNTGIFITFL